MTAQISESRGFFPLADTHCHLDFNVFNNDRDAVLSAAQEKGIAWILNPAVDVLSSQAIVKMVQGLDGVYAAVGVHPNDANSWNQYSLPILQELAGEPKVVAVGEIGLDYYRNHAPREVQRDAFLSQLRLAQDVGLPVIIHTRSSLQDALDILADWLDQLRSANNPLAERPGVLHSFSGDMKDADRAIELGFFIGITGPVTFKNAPALQRLVAQLPLEWLLVETDSPFLTPHPLRGQRNRPDLVRLIAEKIAELQKKDLEEIANTTTANAKRLFAWRERG